MNLRLKILSLGLLCLITLCTTKQKPIWKFHANSNRYFLFTCRMEGKSSC